MGEDDGEDQTGNQWVWICEKEVGDMGNVRQFESQSKVDAKVRAGERVKRPTTRHFDLNRELTVGFVFSGKMKSHSSFIWLTAWCCRSSGLSWACPAVRNSSLEQLPSAMRQCSFFWAWTSAYTRLTAWVRARDLTSCQVPKLTNYQGNQDSECVKCMIELFDFF